MNRKFLSTVMLVAMLVNLVYVPASATPVKAPAEQSTALQNRALVLVNSTSASYLDFEHYIQPYLDHFGVPYAVLDISTADLPADLQTQYGLVITGHRSLDAGTTAYLSPAEQDALSAAVSAGMGLVNFDNNLASGGVARYDYIQDIFGFGYGGAVSGSGVTFTPLSGSSATQINLWEDANQDPDLVTTTNPAALIATDNLWTEFEWTTRGYPAIFGGYDETLPLMHFSGAVPDGEYTLVAHLYWSHNLRYYWGYTADNPQEYSYDVTSGAAGEFSDYTLGTVQVTGGAFDLYVQNADPLTGGVEYPFFGWAWVRLVPAGEPPAEMHYITALHEANTTISTGAMTLAGVSMPAGVTALATSGGQPIVAVANYGQGKAVQFGSYNWMSYTVKGPMYGLDDLVWRSIAWAARKPFVLQAMLPFLTMRMDDESGPFTWIHIANEFGIKPWAGLFYHNVDAAEAADLSQLVHSGNATATVHAKNGSFFYYDHGVGDFPDETIAANYAEATAWFEQYDIPMSEFVLPHYYEFGTNVFQGLSDWGVKYVGTQMDPGNGYGAPWIMNGPFRTYETGSSSSGVPQYYADFMTIPNHPEFENQFFNCVTEIRDDAGYEWYPSNDVALSIGRGVRQTKRALDALALPTLFTHGYYPASITSENWRAILQGITTELAPYHLINVTLDEACAFARAIHISDVSAVSYDPLLRRVDATVQAEPGWTGVDIPTKLYVFTGQGDDVSHIYIDVPAFTGSTTVSYTLAGPLAEITVSPASATVALGGSQQFTAQGYDAEGNPIPNLPFAWSVTAGPGTINPTGLYTAGLTGGTATVQAAYGGISAAATVEVVAPALDHFTIQPVSSPQYIGAPFEVTITARDISDNLLPGYTGPAALSDTTGTLLPVETGTFTGGQWTGSVSIAAPANNVTLTVSDGASSGTSAPFNVLPEPMFYTLTSPQYSYLVDEVFPVSVTAYTGTQINLGEDNHQDPVLAQTSDVPTLDRLDGQWTEFYYPASRPYPSIMAPANEYDTTGLPLMRFYANGIPDGRYQVIANLYQSSPMRYFYGITPDAPMAMHIDTPGGAGGTQHVEFNLGTFEVTGGTFNLYVQDAELLGGTYQIFGWAWIRLVPETASAISFSLADDAHQEPDLVTSIYPDLSALNETDGAWGEFLYPTRGFASIMAGVNEFETYNLPAMHFSAEGIPDGTYEVFANLYDNAPMRMYYSYDPANLDSRSVDTLGGAPGTQHREYSLGIYTVTDGRFDLYARDGDYAPGAAGYAIYGWAHIRLAPAGLSLSSNPPGVEFDADEDGIFGEPGDTIKALTNNTFTVNARGSLPGTQVIITAADVLGRDGSNTYAIVNPNQAPTASDQFVTTPEDTPLLFSLAASDPDGDPLTFTIGAAGHGTLTGTAPDLTYTPVENWSGTDSFTYTVSDGEFSAGPVTVTLSVSPVNDPPVAFDQAVVTLEDTPLSITLAGSDIEDSGLTYLVATPPQHGLLSGTPPELSYLPDVNYTGADSFTFTAADSEAGSSPAVVTIEVTPVEDAPWLSLNWDYRKPVRIASPCTAVMTGYQARITLDSSFDFSKARPDGSDLVVTAADGITILPYWVETWDAAAQQAAVWVRLPELPLSGAAVFLYYGNPDLAPVEVPPSGPFTRQGSIVPIGDPGAGASLLAENIVFDPASGHYWLVFANYRNNSVGLAWSDDPANPNAWHWHSANPVVNQANAPHLLYHNGLWYLFYSDWSTAAPISISVSTATSVGGPYTKVGAVLSPSEDWEAWRVDEPYVFQRDDGKWVIVYMADSGGYHEQVSYATADDILGPYTKYGSEPALAWGPAGSFDAGTIADPWVVEFAGTYYIGYTVSPTIYSPWQTALATTTDWQNFTRHGVILPLGSGDDAANSFRGAVTRVGDTYVFPYTNDGYRMAIATMPALQSPPFGSPAAIFDFQDEFSGTALNTANWTFDSGLASQAAVSGGQLTLTATGTYVKINGRTTLPMNSLVETYARHPQAGTNQFIAEIGLSGAGFTNTVRMADDFHNTAFWEYQAKDSTVTTDPWTTTTIPADRDWHTFRVARLAPNTATFQVDETAPITVSAATVPTINLSAFLMSYGSGNQLVVDWIRARKWCGSEPAISFDREEPRPTQASIAIQKTGPELILYGPDEIVEYAITVSNTGDFTLAGVTVSDPAAPACEAALGDLDPGESLTYSCTGSFSNQASISNTATASGTLAGGETLTASDTFLTRAVQPGVGISVQPLEQSVLSGGSASLQVTVSNTGDIALASVTVDSSAAGDLCSRSLPGGLAIGASTSYTCILPNITADLSVTLQASAAADGVPGVYTSSAAASVSVTPADTGAPWMPGGWRYRRPAIVSNPCAAPVDGGYQVQILLGSDFDFAKAQTGGADLRVTDSDGVTLIPFWIETWDPAAGQASLWVKVPAIPLAGTVVYIYYGNSNPPVPDLTPRPVPPTGPFTRQGSITPIGDPGAGAGLLAENITYDPVTGHYWLVFAVYRGGESVGLAWSDDPANPNAWNWHGIVATQANAPHLSYHAGTWYLFVADRTVSPHPVSVLTSTSVGGPYTNRTAVLSPSEPWEAYRVDEPYVFQRGDGKWVMMYMGDSGGAHEQVSFATADAITGPYTKYGPEPALAWGPAGSFDAGTIADPWVVEFEGTYYIGYTVSPTIYSPWQTALATTTDWQTFTKHGIILPLGSGYDAANSFRGAVTQIGDTYVFPYTNDGYRMALATMPVTGVPVNPVNNRDAVFGFSDTFDGSLLDTAKWTGATGSAAVSGGILTLTSTSGAVEIAGNAAFGAGTLLEAVARHPDADGSATTAAEVGLGLLGRGSLIRILDYNQPVFLMNNTSPAGGGQEFVPMARPLDTQNYLLHRIHWASAGQTRFQIGDDPWETLANYVPGTALQPWLMVYANPKITRLQVDWIRARSFCGADAASVVLSEQVGNQPPAADSQDLSTAEDTPLNITLTGSDPDGDALVYTVASQPEHGTLTGDAPALTYTPDPDYNGPDSFTFTVFDGMDTAGAAVSLTISPVNDPPVFTLSGDLSADEDFPGTLIVTVTPGAIPGDESGQAVTYSLSPDAVPFAQVTIDVDTGAVSVTAVANASGTQQFTITANDGQAENNLAVQHFTLTVNPVNDPPLAGDQIIITAEDTPAPITLTSSDIDSPALTFTVDGGPSHGTLSGTAPDLVYTPDTNFNGDDSFTFTLSDGELADWGVIWIQVTPVNDAPVAADDSYITAEDTTLTVAAPGVLGNDSDADSTTLTAGLVTGPTHGALVLNSDGSFTYTPDANWNSTDSFVYKTSDGELDSANAAVSISITSVNDAPVADAQVLTTPEDTPLALTLTGSDLDGDAITFAYMQPVHGVLTGTAPDLTYTPDPNYNGTDSFTFTVSDGELTSALATVAITVTPVNDVPVADNQSVTTPEDTPRAVTLTGSDIEDDPLLFTVTVLPVHGVLTGTAPDLTYTPDPNFNGTDSFTFTVSDGELTSAPATVTITVTPVNDAPVLDPIGGQSVAEETELTFTAGASDVDLPANTLAFSLTGQPAGAAITAGGVFTWTPTEEQGPGEYTFTVCVSDGALSDCETITVTVSEVNLAPVLDPIGVQSVAEETELTFTASASDVDLPANTLTFSLTGQPAWAAITAGGVFTWTPTEEQGPGEYTFTVCVSDGALSDCETITVTVSEVNLAPVLDPIGGQSVAEETELTFTASASDVDLPANTLTFSLTGQPAGAAITAGGVFTWTPTEEQGPGEYTFTVCVSDGALSDCETITVTVSEVNLAPVLDPIGDQSTLWGDLLTFTATASDVDLPANSLAFSLDPGAPSGAAIDPATGVFTWTPAMEQVGEHSITVRVTDNGVPGLSDFETITVNVAPRPTSLTYNGETAGQYSDGVTLSAVLLDGTAGVPGKTILFTLGSQSVSAVTGSDGVAAVSLTLTQAAASVQVSASFAADGYYLASTASSAFTISRENASVSFADDNPAAVQVATAGGTSPAFSLTFFIREKQPDLGTLPLAGQISYAGGSMQLIPVGPGTPVSGACTAGSVVGTGYAALQPVTCSFASVPVNTYTVMVTVTGNYYTGSAEDVLTIYDPSLGFTTGGGWFYWPGTTDKTNFGFTMKYNKKGSNIQGSLLMIRHMPDGSIYRVKSNALSGLALGSSLDPLMGYATFSGKSTYQEPGWPEPIGNYQFVVYVEDRNEPGTGIDRFWIQVTDGLSMQAPAVTYAVAISGGNIYVPHKAR